MLYALALLSPRYVSGYAYNYGPLGHLKQSHELWTSHVKPGDIVVDATCGNGHDSMFLAKLALTPHSGKLYSIDIQEQAIETAKHNIAKDEHLKRYLLDNRIQLVCGSHETFPIEMFPETVSLICYNLGYLPGKKRTNSPETTQTFEWNEITNQRTTLTSLKCAVPLLKEGGLLSVVAYPGHAGGEEEMQCVQEFLSALDPSDWRVYASVPLNRPKSPTLFNAFRIDKGSNALLK